MNVRVDYKSGTRFLVTSGAHTLISDQPAAYGGGDEGMTPPELLLASLGTCAGYYAVEYLKARKLLAAVSIDVSAMKVASPARLASFRIAVTVDSLLEERHVQGVSRAVHNCLIHNTLLGAPQIEVEVAALCGEAVQ